jgi:hypothetical protein
MEELSFSLIIIFLGIFVALISYLLIDRLVRHIIRKMLKKKTHVLASILDNATRITAILVSLFIFLLSVAYVIGKVDIEASLAESMINMLPKAFIIVLILVVSFVIVQIIRNIFRRLRYKHIEIISLFLQSMIVIASILTILQYIGIQATPFFEIFRVILYTIGLTIALSLGISIGLSIKDKMEWFLFGKEEKTQKRKK